MDILKTLLPKVDCTRGAPMGRFQNESFLKLIENGIKLCVRKVDLDSGGYDIGGAYWGHYLNLYCVFNEECDDIKAGSIYRSFVRANTRFDAINKLKIYDYVKRKSKDQKNG